MNPLLAITAARVGTNILQNLAEQVKGPSQGRKSDAANEADRAKFGEMLSRVAASPEVQRARALRAEGIHDRADAETRLHEIMERLLPAAGVQPVGDSAAFEVKVLADGMLRIRRADGSERTVKLDGEAAELATDARRILGAIGEDRGAALRVDPGNGLTIGGGFRRA